MSEVQINENESADEMDSIDDFIKSVEGEDFNNASKQFDSLLGGRLQDALNQAKIDISSRIYDENVED